MKKEHISIYLSHPIWEQEEGKIIQKYLKSKKIRVYNPFDYESNTEKVIEKDIKLIASSDILLAFLPVPNIGVSMEIMYSWMLHKPIYVITSMKHPWLEAMKIIKCRSKEDFWNKIKKER